MSRRRMGQLASCIVQPAAAAPAQAAFASFTCTGSRRKLRFGKPCAGGCNLKNYDRCARPIRHKSLFAAWATDWAASAQCEGAPIQAALVFCCATKSDTLILTGSMQRYSLRSAAAATCLNLTATSEAPPVANRPKQWFRANLPMHNLHCQLTCRCFSRFLYT